MSIVDDRNTLGADFLSLVTFLSNPEQVKAEYQKIANARAEAQKVIDLVGPASEVLNQREAAIKVHAEAAELMAKAKQDYEELMRAADTDANNLITRVQTQTDAAQDRAAKLRDQADKKVVEANALMEKTQAFKQGIEKTLVKKQAELDSALAAAEEVQQKATAAEAKFNALQKVVLEHFGLMQERLDELKNS